MLHTYQENKQESSLCDPNSAIAAKQQTSKPVPSEAFIHRRREVNISPDMLQTQVKAACSHLCDLKKKKKKSYSQQPKDCLTNKHILNLQIVGLANGPPGGSNGKEPTCQCRRHKRCQFSPLFRNDPLEEGMAPHSSILAWRIPTTEEPGEAESTDLQRVGHD